MTRLTKLTALAAAVALSGGLVACGGGSSTTSMTDDMMEQPDPAIAERAAINSAITTARTTVAGLTDDASDAAIGSADSAVAAAKKAVMDAANVPDTEKAAFNTAIATVESQLATKKTSIMAARDAADDAMMKAMAATGKALHAALGGPDAGGNALTNIAAPTLSAAGLAIDAGAGAGALEADDDPASVTLEAGNSAGALGSWNGMDYALSTGTGDAKVTNEARVYTNQGPGESAPFAEAGYTIIAADAANNAGSVLLVTSGTAETGIDLTDVMASTFEHQGTQNHPIPDNNVALKIRGTFDGAPGEYSCTGVCTSTNNGSGAPSNLGGTWHFKPDTGAMVHQPDDTYLYYGWWVSKNSEGPTAASAFAGVVIPDGGTAPTSLSGADVTGSATYAGNAAGKFAMNNPLDGTGNGGHFTADAELKATFGGGATAGMTGTIDNFRLNDGSEDPGWSVALARGAWATGGGITAPASDPTVWSINGNKATASGTWSGMMYDELPGNAPDGDGSNIPTTVTGTFYSEFSTIGRMVGAFGADLEE